VAYLDLFFEQELDVALGKDGVRLALGNNEIVILDWIPSIFHC
jgi:hypothetical protein